MADYGEMYGDLSPDEDENEEQQPVSSKKTATSRSKATVKGDFNKVMLFTPKQRSAWTSYLQSPSGFEGKFERTVNFKKFVENEKKVLLKDNAAIAETILLEKIPNLIKNKEFEEGLLFGQHLFFDADCIPGTDFLIVYKTRDDEEQITIISYNLRGTDQLVLEEARRLPRDVVRAVEESEEENVRIATVVANNSLHNWQLESLDYAAREISKNYTQRTPNLTNENRPAVAYRVVFDKDVGEYAVLYPLTGPVISQQFNPKDHFAWFCRLDRKKENRRALPILDRFAKDFHDGKKYYQASSAGFVKDGDRILEMRENELFEVETGLSIMHKIYGKYLYSARFENGNVLEINVSTIRRTSENIKRIDGSIQIEGSYGNDEVVDMDVLFNQIVVVTKNNLLHFITLSSTEKSEQQLVGFKKRTTIKFLELTVVNMSSLLLYDVRFSEQPLYEARVLLCPRGVFVWKPQWKGAKFISLFPAQWSPETDVYKSIQKRHLVEFFDLPRRAMPPPPFTILYTPMSRFRVRIDADSLKRLEEQYDVVFQDGDDVRTVLRFDLTKQEDRSRAQMLEDQLETLDDPEFARLQRQQAQEELEKAQDREIERRKATTDPEQQQLTEMFKKQQEEEEKQQQSPPKIVPSSPQRKSPPRQEERQVKPMEVEPVPQAPPPAAVVPQVDLRGPMITLGTKEQISDALQNYLDELQIKLMMNKDEVLAYARDLLLIEAKKDQLTPVGLLHAFPSIFAALPFANPSMTIDVGLQMYFTKISDVLIESSRNLVLDEYTTVIKPKKFRDINDYETIIDTQPGVLVAYKKKSENETIVVRGSFASNLAVNNVEPLWGSRRNQPGSVGAFYKNVEKAPPQLILQTFESKRLQENVVHPIQDLTLYMRAEAPKLFPRTQRSISSEVLLKEVQLTDRISLSVEPIYKKDPRKTQQDIGFVIRTRANAYKVPEFNAVQIANESNLTAYKDYKTLQLYRGNDHPPLEILERTEADATKNQPMFSLHKSNEFVFYLSERLLVTCEADAPYKLRMASHAKDKIEKIGIVASPFVSNLPLLENYKVRAVANFGSLISMLFVNSDNAQSTKFAIGVFKIAGPQSKSFLHFFTQTFNYENINTQAACMSMDTRFLIFAIVAPNAQNAYVVDLARAAFPEQMPIPVEKPKPPRKRPAAAATAAEKKEEQVAAVDEERMRNAVRQVPVTDDDAQLMQMPNEAFENRTLYVANTDEGKFQIVYDTNAMVATGGVLMDENEQNERNKDYALVAVQSVDDVHELLERLYYNFERETLETKINTVREYIDEDQVHNLTVALNLPVEEDEEEGEDEDEDGGEDEDEDPEMKAKLAEYKKEVNKRVTQTSKLRQQLIPLEKEKTELQDKEIITQDNNEREAIRARITELDKKIIPLENEIEKLEAEIQQYDLDYGEVDDTVLQYVDARRAVFDLIVLNSKQNVLQNLSAIRLQIEYDSLRGDRDAKWQIMMENRGEEISTKSVNKEDYRYDIETAKNQLQLLNTKDSSVESSLEARQKIEYERFLNYIIALRPQ